VVLRRRLSTPFVRARQAILLLLVMLMSRHVGTRILQRRRVRGVDLHDRTVSEL
jgi:hypothetical protein